MSGAPRTQLDDPTVSPTKGRVMHSEARYYDVLAWLLTFGHEHAFRERLVDLARIAPGERVLDVGCGTGTLAIAAKRRVGPSGAVDAIDASREMIERAMRKAAKAAIDVRFRTAIVEALPFPDATFDVVVSTLMLHHLPTAVRTQCFQEIRRVLKPGGRVFAVDFATPANARRGLLARLHRHGHLTLPAILDLLSDARFSLVESGSVGVSDLHFALAIVPNVDNAFDRLQQAPVSRQLAPLGGMPWAFLGLGALVVAHALVLFVGWSRLAWPAVIVAGLTAFLVLLHVRGAPSHRQRQ